MLVAHALLVNFDRSSTGRANRPELTRFVGAGNFTHLLWCLVDNIGLFSSDLSVSGFALLQTPSGAMHKEGAWPGFRLFAGA